MFAGRTLPISEDVMVKWRLLVEEGRRVRHTFPQPDLIIAATALVHGMVVVTRDSGDFVRAHVPVFNPWVDPEPVAL
jgi:toxin FitB